MNSRYKVCGGINFNILTVEVMIKRKADGGVNGARWGGEGVSECEAVA